METKILWKPNPGKQTEALCADEFEIGYGGRRGGGKTAAGIAFPLYHKDHPLFRALVIRKNAEDLNDWADRARRIYEPLGAIATGKPIQFVFPSGAVIRSGHLKDENAYGKYQGHEYQNMIIEELTQIPSEDSYLKLIASCRSTIPEIKPQVFATFNPDGAGFSWVKRRFGLHGIPKEIIRTIDNQTKLTRIFIPAGLQDNPYLDRDPQYRSFLNGLPDGLREAWRDGSWDDPIIKGAYYTQELLQARREGRIKLVAHDPRLRVHTIWDMGIDDAMAIGFVQRTSTETRFINYYQNSNQGLDFYIALLQDYGTRYKYNYGKHFAPHDANQREKSSGKTLVQIAETMGLRFEVVPMVGVQDGIQLVRLMFPRLYFNEGVCDQLINGIANYRREWNEQLLKYHDSPVHDWSSHPADVLRYTAVVEEKMTNEDRIAQSGSGFKSLFPEMGEF